MGAGSAVIAAESVELGALKKLGGERCLRLVVSSRGFFFASLIHKLNINFLL